MRFQNGRFDYAFTLWCNSTLGLLLFWWHSNRQQSGRGRTTIRAVESLPVLDLRALSDKQRRTAEAIFNELRDTELKPAYLADADPNRALLDRRVICELLKLRGGDLRCRAPLGRQVVCGAVGAWREAASESCRASELTTTEAYLVFCFSSLLLGSRLYS